MKRTNGLAFTLRALADAAECAERHDVSGMRVALGSALYHSDVFETQEPSDDLRVARHVRRIVELHLRKTPQPATLNVWPIRLEDRRDLKRRAKKEREP